LEAHSLVCSSREFGEGQEDENGSIERGKARAPSFHEGLIGGLGSHYLCGVHYLLGGGCTIAGTSKETWSYLRFVSHVG
jgi:hypothetical protein